MNNKYRRIPQEVEAMQVKAPFQKIVDWCDGSIYMEGPSYKGIEILTSQNGLDCAYKDDWIIKKTNSDYFECMDPTLFEKLYKKVE